MSAFIVEKGVIDVLTQALVNEELVAESEATEIGRLLWHENYLSIDARYGDPGDVDPAEEYTFEGTAAPLEEAIVAKCCHTWQYQTCEYDGWDSARGARLVTFLREMIESRHLGGPRWFAAEYERRNLPVVIDSIDQAVAS